MTTNNFYANRPRSIQLRAGSQVGNMSYDPQQMIEFNLAEGEFEQDSHSGRTEDVFEAMQRSRNLGRKLR